MIIEYFGIPGSGKTYKLTQYKLQLGSKGIPFLDISRYAGMKFRMKLLYKLADILVMLLPKYKNRMNLYIDACSDCKKESLLSVFLNQSFDYCIKDIVLGTLIHDIFRKSSKIVLNDEGLLHRIAMLIVLFEADVNKVMAVYHKEYHQERTVFIDTCVDTAFKNIRNRNRHICGFDKMGDEMLYDYLRKFDSVGRQVIALASD